jgi:hypothetical protein
VVAITRNAAHSAGTALLMKNRLTRRTRRGVVNRILHARLAALARLIDKRSQPNMNALWRIAKDLDIIKLNLKFFGYELARQLTAALPVREGLAPQRIELKSKPSTQTDLEADWVAYWAAQLETPVIFHRKLWELAYVLQALHQNDMIRPGARGLGFGCGIEPIPSYLASQGVRLTVTDLPPPDERARGWQDTSQHVHSLEQSHHAHLVSREDFDRLVDLTFVDMTAIPADLRDYDFNWSVCALEHLGSIKNGLDFVEHCLETLRPGGISVHTTEYNFLNDRETIDNWESVLFQRQHFEQLKGRLEARGHRLAPLDFDVGNKPLDRFIDIPPFVPDWTKDAQRLWGGDATHIKLGIDGFVCTCFGLTITKNPQA